MEVSLSDIEKYFGITLSGVLQEVSEDIRSQTLDQEIDEISLRSSQDHYSSQD